MYLLRHVAVLDALSKSAHDRVYNNMSHFMGQVFVWLQRLQNQLHKLSSRRIHSMSFLVDLGTQALYSLAHYELESYVDDSLNILAVAQFELHFT